MLKRSLELLTYSFFPKRCPCCGTLITANELTCIECSGGISYIEPPLCLRCGRNVMSCTCAEEKYRFSYLAAPFKYEGTVRKMLHRFKFDGETEYKSFFAHHMALTAAKQYSTVSFDYITCVPMTAKDRKKRGYNQSALIAKEIGYLLNIEFCEDIVKKTVQTFKQHDLTAAERKINLVGAFSAQRQEVEGKNILLCDDIKTTGSTLWNCCAALKAAGANEVYCLCAAITGLDSFSVVK